ncbi:MAG TPA: nucleotidyltransferase family protein [Terriglobia bacterium]|nr:nucleotidyltransferase family protein [Terriglobia bacterium]
MGQKGSTIRTMEAVVLAGGRGTRLRGAVSGFPKSLAPIGHVPFLSYLLGWLRDQGVIDIILAVGYRRQDIVRQYHGRVPAGVRLRYSAETSPLGTGGALRNLRMMLAGEEFLVLNGDSIFDVNLRKMLSFHRQHRAQTTLALASPPEAGRYGSVILDGRGRIKAFVEKKAVAPAGEDCGTVPRLISGGLYIMNKAVFRHIPGGRAVSLEKEVFPRLIGGPFYGFPSKGYFIDIGIPEDYRRANTELMERFTAC